MGAENSQQKCDIAIENIDKDHVLIYEKEN